MSTSWLSLTRSYSTSEDKTIWTLSKKKRKRKKKKLTCETKKEILASRTWTKQLMRCLANFDSARITSKHPKKEGLTIVSTVRGCVRVQGYGVASALIWRLKVIRKKIVEIGKLLGAHLQGNLKELFLTRFFNSLFRQNLEESSQLIPYLMSWNRYNKLTTITAEHCRIWWQFL